MKDDWLEVTAKTGKDTVEELENWFFEAGALSVTLRDSDEDEDLSHAVLEPVPGEVRLWDAVTVVALFSRETTPEDLQNALHLSAAVNGVTIPVYTMSTLGDQAWERSWMDTFKPMQFGAGFWICPTAQAVPDEHAVTLRLDPGLAFGTGTHATTAQCLHWLGQHTKHSLKPFAGMQVVDFGCGSGVLAIAALLLGADHAWAVDIDEQALSASRSNALQNGVLDQLSVGQPELVSAITADILMANILFKPLMELADKLAQNVKPGGRLLLSGILADQMDALRMRYNANFEFDPGQVQDGWAMMTATRR